MTLISRLRRSIRRRTHKPTLTRIISRRMSHFNVTLRKIATIIRTTLGLIRRTMRQRRRQQLTPIIRTRNRNYNTNHLTNTSITPRMRPLTTLRNGHGLINRKIIGPRMTLKRTTTRGQTPTLLNSNLLNLNLLLHYCNDTLNGNPFTTTQLMTTRRTLRTRLNMPHIRRNPTVQTLDHAKGDHRHQSPPVSFHTSTSEYTPDYTQVPSDPSSTVYQPSDPFKHEDQQATQNQDQSEQNQYPSAPHEH